MIDELKDEMNGRFDEVSRRFDEVDRRFDEQRHEIDGRFDEVDRRFGDVDRRLDEQSAQMRTLFEALRQDIRTLAEAVDAGFRRIDRHSVVLAGHDTRLGHHELRLRRLEARKPGRS